MEDFLSFMSSVNKGEVIASAKGKVPTNYLVQSTYLNNKMKQFSFENPEYTKVDLLKFLKTTESDMQKYLVNIPIDEENEELLQNDLISRDSERSMLHLYLNRAYKNNVVIVGEPGIGKTALVMNYLKYYHQKARIISVGELLTDTKYRGEFEGKLNKIIQEAKKKKLILFFDEIHTLLHAGNTDGGISAGNLLKPIITNKSIRIIGATTPNEVDVFLDDKAFQRRFNFIRLREPADDEIYKIYIYYLELFDLIEFKDKYRETRVFLDTNYPDRYYPDKLIDFIDFWSSASKTFGFDYLKTQLLFKSSQFDFNHDQRKM